jgi:hypothetical protein
MRPRAAVARYSFTIEGIFRRVTICKGSNLDTA